MNNEEDAQYLLEFHRKFEQRLSKILLKAGKDLEQLAMKVTDDIDRLAYVIHESTISRQPPLWNLLSDGDDDDGDKDNDGRPTVAPIAAPNIQPPTSSIRDQSAPESPMTAEEELRITLAMINKVGGATHTSAEVQAARTCFEHATSLWANAESSINSSSEAANSPPTLHSKPNTKIKESITLPPEDIEAANILLDLSTTPANITIVDTFAAAPEVQKEVPAASKGKHKANTNKRKAAAESEYKDSDYPHHRHIGPLGGDPLGISDPTKGPAQVMEESSPPAKRTRTRR